MPKGSHGQNWKVSGAQHGGRQPPDPRERSDTGELGGRWREGRRLNSAKSGEGGRGRGSGT